MSETKGANIMASGVWKFIGAVMLVCVLIAFFGDMSIFN